MIVCYEKNYLIFFLHLKSFLDSTEVITDVESSGWLDAEEYFHKKLLYWDWYTKEFRHSEEIAGRVVLCILFT